MTDTRRSPLLVAVLKLAIPAGAEYLDVHGPGTPRRVPAGR